MGSIPVTRMLKFFLRKNLFEAKSKRLKNFIKKTDRISYRILVKLPFYGEYNLVG